MPPPDGREGQGECGGKTKKAWPVRPCLSISNVLPKNGRLLDLEGIGNGGFGARGTEFHAVDDLDDTGGHRGIGELWACAPCAAHPAVGLNRKGDVHFAFFVGGAAACANLGK